MIIEFYFLNFDQFYKEFCKVNLGFLGVCVDCFKLYVVYQVLGEEKVIQVVWDSYDIKGIMKCGWELVMVDISNLSGKMVGFCFEFDMQDGIGNNYEGFYIDDFCV